MKSVLKINNAVMQAQVHSTKPAMHEAFIKVIFDKLRLEYLQVIIKF